MVYHLAQPPYTLKFTKMSGDELAGFYAWFFDVMPERLEELVAVVTGTDRYADWSADQSPGSLDALGDWYAGQVEMRPRTIDEMNELRLSSTMNIEIAGWELTNRTFSLALDIGMYVAKTMQKQHPNVCWQQPLDDRRFVDYGRPVLDGFGVATFIR